VSDNTRDFGTRADKSELHDHLIEELATLNVHDRVSWVRTLQDLVFLLAAEHTPGTTDLTEIQNTVREQSVITFIRNDVLPSAQGRALDPMQCALPLGTLSASITSVAEPQDIEFGHPGQGPDNETIIQFSFSARTEISVRPLPNLTLKHLGIVDDSDGIISKQLMYSGIVTADEYGRASEGELTVIEAESDDPGLFLWKQGDGFAPPASLIASGLAAVHPAADFTSDARSVVSPEFISAALEIIKNPSRPAPPELQEKLTRRGKQMINAELLCNVAVILALAIRRVDNQEITESGDRPENEK
jgi:hypothetical protein